VPGISIGINVLVYPQLVRVPGYPVYYDPRSEANYFFYDGLYWVYSDDSWYESSWYNGPWREVGPAMVPLYVLRVPVRYYRRPPPYFRGWQAEAPPRWNEHWGAGWQQQRPDWNRWDRRNAPAPAPLPNYQRQYNGPRYPDAQDRQDALRDQNYRFRPRDPATQEHLQPRDNRDNRGNAPPPQRPPQEQADRRSPPERQVPRVPQPAPERAMERGNGQQQREHPAPQRERDKGDERDHDKRDQRDQREGERH